MSAKKSRPAGVQSGQPAAELAGGSAEQPTDIPAKGWLQVAKRAWAEAKDDQVPLLSAGVAFFGFLSLFPALIAAILTYGLFADPAQVRDHIAQLSGTLPSAARSLLEQQATSLASSSSSALGVGLAFALAAALWSASGGVGNLMTAVNIAYDEEEKRGFLKRKAMALLLTLGAIVFVVVALVLVALAPPLLEALGLPGWLHWLLSLGRWVVVALVVSAALAVVYRLAPSRDAPQMRWVSIGAVVATVLWLVASIGFSIYADTFGSYGETYGSVAGAAVLMLWLWITAFIVLLGAEINAESEEQTGRDTTVGPEQPLGQRRAVKADSRPPAKAARRNGSGGTSRQKRAKR